MSGLTANTNYYVRAYATNANGTAYGSTYQFTTMASAQAWIGITRARIKKWFCNSIPILNISLTLIEHDPSAGGTDIITVTCNGSWSLTISDSSWIHTNVSSGNGNGSVTVTMDPGQAIPYADLITFSSPGAINKVCYCYRQA
jgi:hypothetical protein